MKGWSDEFAGAFFGPGNRLRWDAISKGVLPPDAMRKLEPWLDDARNHRFPLCLPRAMSDRSVQWYVIPGSPAEERALRTELLAFVGPSYSTYRGQPAQLSPSDPVDEAVAEHFGTSVFRCAVTDPALVDPCREKLLLFRSLRRDRPKRTVSVVRPAGRILSDFENALRYHDAKGAQDCIEELRSQGRLTTDNLAFLEVRAAAAFSRWSEIRLRADFDALARSRRPRLVTEALIQSLYDTELLAFETANDPKSAAEHFGRELRPRYGALFAAAGRHSEPAVSKSLLLIAATATPPRAELARSVLESYPADSADRPYVEALAALTNVDAPPPKSGLEGARVAWLAGDVDLAFKLAVAAPATAASLSLTLQAALEIGSLDTAARAVEAVDSAPGDTRQRLLDLAVSAAAYRILCAVLAPAPSVLSPAPDAKGQRPTPIACPRDWAEWLERLSRDNPWPGAADFAQRASTEWDVGTYRTDSELVGRCISALATDLPPWGKEVLRTSVPHLMRFFFPDLTPHREFLPLYWDLAAVVAWDDQLGTSQLPALTDLVEALIGAGVDSDKYRDAVEFLLDSLNRLKSPKILDWALDTLDVLLEYPAPDEGARSKFATQTAELLRSYHRRVNRLQADIFGSLAEEIGIAVPHEVSTRKPDASGEGGAGLPLDEKLKDRTIAIYSLCESALKRSAESLQRNCPSARVMTFHDKVGGSAALKTQAATADVFVIATRSAKHAATNFVEAHRPKTLRTVYAAGKGSASIIRALEDLAPFPPAPAGA